MLTRDGEFEEILLEFEKNFLDEEKIRLGIRYKFVNGRTRRPAVDEARPEFEKILANVEERGVNVATAGTMIASWRAVLACQRRLAARAEVVGGASALDETKDFTAEARRSREEQG